MRLLIPTIGTVLTLDEDWTFDLHRESRNVKFAANFGIEWERYFTTPWEWVTLPGGMRKRVEVPPMPTTLPAGTVLKVDRIYIRSKAADFRSFDSVTFYCNPGLKGKAAKGKPRGRFWAKILDVNRMEVLIDPNTMPMHEYVEDETGPAAAPNA